MRICLFVAPTRPGVDKVKPKGWFKYSLQIDLGQLVHPALNLSTLDAGILIMVQ